jgi:hypothetical protein
MALLPAADGSDSYDHDSGLTVTSGLVSLRHCYSSTVLSDYSSQHLVIGSHRHRARGGRRGDHSTSVRAWTT